MADNTSNPTLSTTVAPDIDLTELLPVSEGTNLTQAERNDASRHQNALNILGPAAGAALVCPGNQVGLDESQKCPYSAKCVLLRARKAPQGELCPIEAEHISSQFRAWTTELEKTTLTLTASERAVVSELVWLDVQEHRCASILSKGDAARLTQLNPKEVHPETLEPIAWERVIHANTELLDRISTKRRMLLKEWMLNPEQKAKKARWENKGTGQDQSSLQAAFAARLRKVMRSPVLLDVPKDDSPTE